jgi:hypothetical protein
VDFQLNKRKKDTTRIGGPERRKKDTTKIGGLSERRKKDTIKDGGLSKKPTKERRNQNGGLSTKRKETQPTMADLTNKDEARHLFEVCINEEEGRSQDGELSVCEGYYHK